MDKKFNINGREKEWFYLSNNELVDLLESDISAEDKEFINKQIISRFKQENCTRNSSEDNHDVFARQFSNFMNGKCYDMKKTAKLLANDHRYLVQEMFKLNLAFIKKLAENYQNGIYDGRNEWACQTANFINEKLESIGI